jgi:hypothetical protein
MEVTDTKNEDVGAKYKDKISSINETVSKINAASGDKTKIDPLLASSSNLRREAEDGMSRYDQMQQDWQQNEQTDNQTTTTAEEKKDTTTADTADELYTEADTKNAALLEQTQSDLTDVENTYNRIQKFADRAHRNLISATRQIYGARLKKMEDSMDRLVKTRQVGNVRQGRDRYAPELASGIMTDQELTGNERLSEIEGQMLSAIATADQAKANRDLEGFNAQLKNVESIMDRMNSQIKENYEIAKERDKAIRDQEREARMQEKQDFDTMLDKSKRAAPALAEKLDGLSPEQQAAVVEEYAKLSGVDMDVLLGDIAGAAQDRDYKNLQVENLENQIYNRNRDTNIAAQREARLQREADNKKTEEESKISDFSLNVINEISTIADIEKALEDKPSELAAVKRELNDYGIFDQSPPDWFIEKETDGKGMSVMPTEVQRRWDEWRGKYVESKGGI